MSITMTRRDLAKLGLGLGAAAALGRNAFAQTPAFFRIGTGGTAGTYYPVGGLIANAISNPPQLVLTAQASNGSVANVNSIVSGALESGFTQADVAYWAYSGTGLFEGKGKMEDLRLIANLYPESIHLVAAKSANIKSVADLKGKRVSLDEPGSGTLVDARIILSGWGIKETDVKADFLKPNQAAERMRDGGMDAFFFVGGYPTSAITELAATGGGVDLVPLSGAEADAIRKQYSFFAADEIPADTYKNVGAVKTLAVGAQWVTSSKVPDAVVYEVTKGLWGDKARAALDTGHAKGKRVSLDEPGSGTLVDARIILSGWGIKESDVKADFLKPNQAAERMRDGGMDAFFFVGGYPTSAITELAATGGGVDLVPLSGAEAEAIRKQYSFFAADEIPAETYKNVGAVKTLAVGAQWVTSSKVPDAVVYEVTKGLWGDKARAALDTGHAKGKLIRKENALAGAGIPLHAGAERFYKEAGLSKS